MRARFLATAIGLAAGLVLAVACASHLDALAPFPCANDGTCPSGFSCVPGTGCTEGLPLDGTCTTGTKCATGDCVGGLCVPRCAPGGDPACATGRVCSYPPPGESLAGAHCLLDCATTSCPTGLTCSPIYGAVKGCTAPAASAAIDKACVTPEDCQLLYGATFLPVTCVRGACASFCATPAVPCADPARTCHVAQDPALSGCLAACGAGDGDAGACPEGLACKPAIASEPAMCANPSSP